MIGFLPMSPILRTTASGGTPVSAGELKVSELSEEKKV